MKDRRIRVGIIITETDKRGVHYSKPTYAGWFYLDTGRIEPEDDEDEDDESTYTYEMLMPSGTVVPIEYDHNQRCYVVKGEDEE